ncbi:MAG: alpha/beta hydrolase [Coriobacteriia bacterium]|nr:alpha/beta hydrolase [Coriobacteriia bacterium]
MPTAQGRPTRRGILALLVVALVLAVTVIGFTVWALTPSGPSDDAIAALVSDDTVLVTAASGGFAYTSPADEPTFGIILYPGGRVDARSYAPLARELALRGYLVIVPRMTLNLAVFSPNRAAEAIDSNPQIRGWAVGGHSLGGAMAASFAHNNPELVDALVLIAAYPAGSADLSDSGLTVVSIYGTEDGVLSEARFSDGIGLLPDDTRYVAIEGGNHAQFGSYGRQPGDGVATITPQEQLLRTTEAISSALLPLRLKTR